MFDMDAKECYHEVVAEDISNQIILFFWRNYT